MSLSIIIPSKTASNLIPCVEAVRKHESDAQIIVVDDGVKWDEISVRTFLCPVSRKCRCQGCGEVVTRHSPCGCSGVVIDGIKPFIFARAVNQGITEALKDEACAGVVLLNDDALLQTPGGFMALAAFAEAHPDVGCVAPATNVTGQPLQWLKNRTPEGYRFVDSVPYVCVYIPRRTFERVGLLDERYSIDYGVEDLDHTYAMRQAGLKIAVMYDVFVNHGSLRSSFRGDPRQPKSFQQNYALFKAKWGIR